MNDRAEDSGWMDLYEGFVALHKGRILPLSAIGGGQEEKLPKENTMEDKNAEELQRKISQYELLADLLSVAYKYSGVLTTEYILCALDAAVGTLEQDLDEDTPGEVEDKQQKMKLELNYQTPYVPSAESWTEQTASFADYGPTPAPGDEENTP